MLMPFRLLKEKGEAMKKLTTNHLRKLSISIYPDLNYAQRLCEALITTIPASNFLSFDEFEQNMVASMTLTALLDGEKLMIIDGFQSPLFLLERVPEMNVTAQKQSLERAQLDAIWVKTLHYAVLSMDIKHIAHNMTLLQTYVPTHVCQKLFGKKRLTTQIVCDLIGVDRSTLSHQRSRQCRMNVLPPIITEE